jgi:hypothetical protein
VLEIFTGDERIVEEDLLALEVRDPMLSPVLVDIAIVPIESLAFIKLFIRIHSYHCILSSYTIDLYCQVLGARPLFEM